MKILLLLALTIACVDCETCTDAGDCQITTCSTGGIQCSNGVCTCTAECDPEQDYTRCRGAQDCLDDWNNGQFKCECATSDLHCIDGRCHCGYPANPTLH